MTKKLLLLGLLGFLWIGCNQEVKGTKGTKSSDFGYYKGTPDTTIYQCDTHFFQRILTIPLDKALVLVIIKTWKLSMGRL